ncbi:PIN domain-containing protein [Actinomadura rupiterrae]|uniref:PIN domain-containing protein n=1 Tax=Actinomadura rupiterrae TaxID=559627 RepID=UPI0020A45BA1|nr:PIN domain-containing protein [Actinomadura rupiterrae]MCP2335827.1 putative nucleic acid-binding protein [Actinomadura rupiterrae]
MTRAPLKPSPTVVLDCEGLSRLVRRDREMFEWAAGARNENVPMVVSAVSIVEATHPETRLQSLDWTLSHLRIVPVTREISLEAVRLLRAADRHGHKHAIDAVVAATALAASQPAVILTSDPDDFMTLCGDRAAVIKI